MVESEAYYIQNIDILCETDNINFYAREAGFFSGLLERETDTNLKQFYLYFLENAEKELEAANGRLGEYRKELNSWHEQQRQLQPV